MEVWVNSPQRKQRVMDILNLSAEPSGKIYSWLSLTSPQPDGLPAISRGLSEATPPVKRDHKLHRDSGARIAGAYSGGCHRSAMRDSHSSIRGYRRGLNPRLIAGTASPCSLAASILCETNPTNTLSQSLLKTDY